MQNFVFWAKADTRPADKQCKVPRAYSRLVSDRFNNTSHVMYKVIVNDGVENRRQPEPEERTLVARLAVREREVRAGEMRRLADAGALAAGIDYVYERGPDGTMRVTSGRMRIIVPPGGISEEVQVQIRQRTAASLDSSRLPEAVSVQQISKERVESLGDLPGVCSFTSFGGLNRTA
jgi:hypothetical protein